MPPVLIMWNVVEVCCYYFFPLEVVVFSEGVLLLACSPVFTRGWFFFNICMMLPPLVFSKELYDRVLIYAIVLQSLRFHFSFSEDITTIFASTLV